METCDSLIQTDMKTQKKRVKQFNVTQELFKCSYDIQGAVEQMKQITIAKSGQHPNVHRKLDN